MSDPVSPRRRRGATRAIISGPTNVFGRENVSRSNPPLENLCMSTNFLKLTGFPKKVRIKKFVVVNEVLHTPHFHRIR